MTSISSYVLVTGVLVGCHHSLFTIHGTSFVFRPSPGLSRTPDPIKQISPVVSGVRFPLYTRTGSPSPHSFVQSPSCKVPFAFVHMVSLYTVHIESSRSSGLTYLVLLGSLVSSLHSSLSGASGRVCVVVDSSNRPHFTLVTKTHH